MSPPVAIAKVAIASACAVTALAWAPTAHAETAAGTAILNTARLSYASSGVGGNVDSNQVRIVVAERLDVTLAAGATTTAADGGNVVAAVLTNAGNGQEAFAITATVAGDGDAIRVVAVDSDGDGRYDPARDAPMGDGRTPPLAADQSLTIFVIATPGATGPVTLTAAAVTGSGPPGTGFAGTGDGGGDAVTGPTGANASITLSVPGGAMPSLIKSAAVVAPDGSPRAVRGATITYTLVASFPAATTAAAVVDPIPAGAAYAPASVTLDDAPLSDAADADPGAANATRISVALGDQPAGATRTIRFKVIIQ